MKIFDTHAHYDDAKFDEDREDLLKKIYDYGEKKYVNVGCDIDKRKKSIRAGDFYIDFLGAVASEFGLVLCPGDQLGQRCRLVQLARQIYPELVDKAFAVAGAAQLNFLYHPFSHG